MELNKTRDGCETRLPEEAFNKATSKTFPRNGTRILTLFTKKLSFTSRPGPKSSKVKLAGKKNSNLLKKTLLSQAKKAAAVAIANSLKMVGSKHHRHEDTNTSVTTDNDDLKANCYTQDVYEYMKELEQEYLLPNDFLEGRSIATICVRNVLADWLIRVNAFCRFHLETYYLAIGIIDRYLEAKDLSLSDFKVLGVTALFIATKYEENYQVKPKPFGVSTQHFDRDEINKLEIEVLQVLGFRLGFPLPIPFYRLLSRVAATNQTERNIGRYLMELSLCHHELASCPPSLYAAAALYLALRVSRQDFTWSENLVSASEYSEEELLPIVQVMSCHLLRSCSKKYKFRAARDKYAQPKFHGVSLMRELSLSSTLLHNLAKS